MKFLTLKVSRTLDRIRISISGESTYNHMYRQTTRYRARDTKTISNQKSETLIRSNLDIIYHALVIYDTFADVLYSVYFIYLMQKNQDAKTASTQKKYKKARYKLYRLGGL